MDPLGEDAEGEVEDGLFFSSEQLAQTNVVSDEGRDDTQTSASPGDTAEMVSTGFDHG